MNSDSINEKPIRLMIVDDLRLFVDALKMMLMDIPGMEVVASCSSAEEAIQTLQEKKVDIILLDIRLGEDVMNGLDAAEYIYENFPWVKVLMLSMHKKGEYINQTLRNNIAGYLLKDSAAQELVKAVRTIANGGTYFSTEVMQTHMDFTRKQHRGEEKIKLTPREKEILQLIVEGFSTLEIGEKLCVGEAGIETHRRNLRHKLKVNNTAGLVREAILQNLVDTDNLK
ncbi:MAG: response regulator transcription factor [Bacteroidia bacterium]|nr:response regulator transcription factor [Bacteroidota bacterium]